MLVKHYRMIKKSCLSTLTENGLDEDDVYNIKMAVDIMWETPEIVHEMYSYGYEDEELEECLTQIFPKILKYQNSKI